MTNNHRSSSLLETMKIYNIKIKSKYQLSFVLHFIEFVLISTGWIVTICEWTSWQYVIVPILFFGYWTYLFLVSLRQLYCKNKAIEFDRLRDIICSKPTDSTN